MDLNINELKRSGVIAQKQKNYFLFRLRTVAGELSGEQLKSIADISEKFADGKVHLTTRQAVEIHNIHVSKLKEAREELEKEGNTLGTCGPRGRGIVACPGNSTCTSGIIETKKLARELDALYFRKEAPHKFKIGISGCANSCTKPIENDVGIMGGVLPHWSKDKCVNCKLCLNICPSQALENREDHFVLHLDKCIFCGLCIRNCPSNAWEAGKTGYTLLVGGTLGKKPRLGTKAKVLIESKEELLQYIRRAFEFYVKNGRKKERFGHTLDRIGVEKALEEILSDKHQTLDLRGVSCPMNFVKAKVTLEDLDEGQQIEFILDEGEPLVNVTRSLKDEGHSVINVTPEEMYFRVLVEKSKDAGIQAVNAEQEKESLNYETNN
ncbi:MAG: sulfurtransferase TusA family protein [Thermodesulfovibrionia bacterium]|nr:sulfurtransferase TusA family protein [Thermodesulfovibrionia bacterium]